MTALRTRYIAEYQYPGSFFPESTSREVTTPTFDSAVINGPDEDGYFTKDRWYAVRIAKHTEKRFVADDGEVTWVRQGKPEEVGAWIVGDRIHFSDIELTDANRILISNIECNSRDGGFGVLTRCGNWQIASDYTEVIAPAAAVTS